MALQVPGLRYASPSSDLARGQRLWKRRGDGGVLEERDIVLKYINEQMFVLITSSQGLTKRFGTGQSFPASWKAK